MLNSYNIISKFNLNLIQLASPVLTNNIQRIVGSTVQLELVRHRRTKHFDPKYKWYRMKKYIKVEFPKVDEKKEDLTEDEIRARFKEMGIQPPRPWQEKQFYVSSTGGIFEPYVPPEGDGKSSIISATGAKQSLQFLEKKSKSMMAIRKIKSYEDDFIADNFVQQAQDTYLQVHEYMAKKDLNKLEDLCTEHAYPLVTHNIQNKTIKWQFLKSIEPPRIVHARVTDIVAKTNLFAQITVRFHTQQMLAIYDRFGRLMHGSTIIGKDVLEYVVFEKHISNEYGMWRLHDKIIPDWIPKPEPSSKTTMTFVKDIEKEQVEVVEENKEIEEVTKPIENQTSSAQATAT